MADQAADPFRAALKPGYGAFYDLMASSAGGQLPIAIDWKQQEGRAVITKNEGNETVFKVPYTAVVWTKELFSRFQLKDEDIGMFPKAPAATQELVNRMAGEVGLKNIPVLIAGQTLAEQTAGGMAYIKLEQKHLDSKGLEGIIAHELGHIRANDHTAEAIVKVLNNPSQGLEIMRGREFAADRFAVENGYGKSLAQGLTGRHADEKFDARIKREPLEERYAQDTHGNGLHRIANVVEAIVARMKNGNVTSQEAGSPENVPSVPKSSKTPPAKQER